MASSIHLFNTVLEVLAGAVRHEKAKTTRYKDWIRKVKLGFFSGDMSVYIENPK